MSLLSAAVKTQAAQLLFGTFTLLVLPFLSGCGFLPKVEAEAKSQPVRPQQDSNRLTPVDIAVARTGSLKEATSYTGTTRPVREVSLRAQVEGRLLNLQVDMGDSVTQGQILAQLDDALLVTAVSSAEAELAARQSEVARAQTQVSNARARAEQARVELQQAKVDAARLQNLSKAGAISKQEAELAQTAAKTAEQAVISAQEQIRTEQQAVAAAQGRVKVQQAVIAESRERLSYARLISPINGAVLQKVSEPGNLIQPGGEILKLGDFSQVKVEVPVSELELSNIRVGQPVQVQLDAFGREQFFGEVSRISPAADAARQVPIEITIPNKNGKIGSGLLARVNFTARTAERVIIPQTALEAAQARGRGGAGRQRSSEAVQQGNRGGSSESAGQPRQGQVFVVTGKGKQAKVQARPVTLGEQADGKVEILSGLKPGDRFVSRSGKPLKDGETVALSILSEG